MAEQKNTVFIEILVAAIIIGGVSYCSYKYFKTNGMMAMNRSNTSMPDSTWDDSSDDNEMDEEVDVYINEEHDCYLPNDMIIDYSNSDNYPFSASLTPSTQNTWNNVAFNGGNSN